MRLALCSSSHRPVSRPRAPSPPVTSHAPQGSLGSSSGAAATILPMWRAWASSRSASGTLAKGSTVRGRGWIWPPASIVDTLVSALLSACTPHDLQGCVPAQVVFCQPQTQSDTCQQEQGPLAAQVLHHVLHAPHLACFPNPKP